MQCALLLLSYLASVGTANAAAPAKDDQPKPGEYRAKVEVILEPSGDNSVYRVQVWTHGKQQVLFCIDGNLVHIEGTSYPEPESKLWRTEWVIIASLRDAPDKDARHRLLGRAYECNWGSSFATKSKVDPEAKLKDISQIKAATTVKLEGRVLIGKLADQKLEVVARPPGKE